MSDENTLIITAWGDPKGWFRARYVVETPEDLASDDFEVEGVYRSTLAPLQRTYKGSRVLLFVQSSLRAPSDESYQRLKRDVEEYIRSSYLQNKEYCDEPDAVDVVVLPAVGRFSVDNVQVKHKGRVEIFRSASALACYEKLLEVRPKRVVVDLSHGINYMPVYLNQSAVSMLSLYAAANQDRGVRLLVYNSEPMPRLREKTETPQLVINLIEDIHVRRGAALEAVYDLLERFLNNPNRKAVKFLARGRPSEDEKKMLVDAWRGVLDAVAELVLSARWGLGIPLASAVERLRSENVSNLIQLARKLCYLGSSDFGVSISGGEIEYRYSVMFESILCLALADLIVGSCRVLRVDDGFLLDDLVSVMELLGSRVGSLIFSHESHQLRQRVLLAKRTGVALDVWVPYSTLIEVGELRTRDGRRLLNVLTEDKTDAAFEELSGEILEISRRSAGGSVAEPDSRNFVAHGGLERGITLVRAYGDTVLVKYRDDSWEKVERIIRDLRA